MNYSKKNKKIRPVQKSLFYLILIGVIIVTIPITFLQIDTLEDLYAGDEELIKNNIENTATSYIDSINLIFTIIENRTNKRVEDLGNLVIKKYNQQSKWNFLSKGLLDDTDHIDINIINDQNIIFKSTNKENIGINYSNDLKMTKALDKIRTEGESYIDGRDTSVLTREPMNFTYKCTEDKQYIVQIAINLSKYAKELKQTAVIKNMIGDLMNNDYVVDIAYFDNSGARLGILTHQKHSLLNIAEEDRPYFQKAINNNEAISTDKKLDKLTLKENYVPHEIVRDNESTVVVIKITYIFENNYTEFIMCIIIAIIISSSCILIFSIFMWLKVDMLLSPIDKLLRGMNEVAGGRYDFKINIKTNNQFKILGDNFNNMVKEISTNKREVIEQRDEITALYEQQIATSHQLEEALTANKETYFETIEALAKSIDAKDPYTKGHCQRVMEYSVAIAKEMEFSDCQLDDLKYGALLHDIGKIGIPEEILNKKGRLTEEEFSIIKSHTTIGYNIIKDIDFLSKAKEIVYEHHEKVDGTGYPNGLKKDECNIFSKIVCVADSYDAMTSNRAYRKSMNIEDVITELEKGKASQFDSKVVDVFIKLIKNNKLDNLTDKTKSVK